jgi:hypothetical protein
MNIPLAVIVTAAVLLIPVGILIVLIRWMNIMSSDWRETTRNCAGFDVVCSSDETHNSFEMTISTKAKITEEPNPADADNDKDKACLRADRSPRRRSHAHEAFVRCGSRELGQQPGWELGPLSRQPGTDPAT